MILVLIQVLFVTLLVLYLPINLKFVIPFQVLNQWFISHSRNFFSLSNVCNGLKLEEVIGKIAYSYSIDKIKNLAICQYKFFTQVLFIILQQVKLNGASFKKELIELKKGVMIDLRFERGINKEMGNAYLQFLLMAIITWGFLYLVEYVLQERVLVVFKIIGVLIQLIGFLIFMFLIKKKRIYIFGPFGIMFEILYKIKLLSAVRLSVRDVLTQSNLDSLDFVTKRDLDTLKLKLKSLVSEWSVNGKSMQDDLEFMLSELWHLYEENLLVFKNNISLYKFMILALFYLPVYLFNIISLVTLVGEI